MTKEKPCSRKSIKELAGLINSWWCKDGYTPPKFKTARRELNRRGYSVRVKSSRATIRKIKRRR